MYFDFRKYYVKLDETTYNVVSLNGHLDVKDVTIESKLHKFLHMECGKNNSGLL